MPTNFPASMAMQIVLGNYVVTGVQENGDLPRPLDCFAKAPVTT